MSLYWEAGPCPGRRIGRARRSDSRRNPRRPRRRLGAMAEPSSPTPWSRCRTTSARARRALELVPIHYESSPPVTRQAAGTSSRVPRRRSTAPSPTPPARPGRHDDQARAGRARPRARVGRRARRRRAGRNADGRRPATGRGADPRLDSPRGPGNPSLRRRVPGDDLLPGVPDRRVPPGAAAPDPRRPASRRCSACRGPPRARC